MGQPYADLHLHSLHSDGALAPAEVVENAAQSGIQALSLSDHDTLAGLKEAETACKKHGLDFMPGVELTLGYEKSVVHLLVYGPLLLVPPVLALVRVARHRNRRFLSAFCGALQSQGVEAPLEALEGLSLRSALKALTLVCRSVLGGNAKAVWAKSRVQAQRELGNPAGLEKVLGLLQEAPAVTCLAHPSKTPGRPGGFSQDELAEFRGIGLDALEVNHGSQSSQERQALSRQAKALGLLPLGGSDCHFRKGWPELGSGGVDERTYLSVKERLGF